MLVSYYAALRHHQALDLMENNHMAAKRKSSSTSRRKKTTRKSSPAARKRSKVKKSTPKRKKTARKKATRKKASRKKVTRKKVSRKKVSRKKGSRKKVSRKKVSRKKVSRKKASRKKTTRKKVSRKKVSRKKVSRKKVSRKKTTSRRKKSASKKRSTTSRRKSASKKRVTKKRSTTKKRTASRKKSTAKRRPSPRKRNTSTRAAAAVLDNSPIPTLALEDYTPQIAKAEGIKDTSKGSTKIGWIGAGQCGGRLVKSFYDLGYKKVLAVNTAYHDLDDLDLPESQKLLLDIGRKGAGKDIARGREAAQEYRQEIIHSVEKIFSDNVDHVMVAFGSGGGTGSGCVIPILETIKSCAKHIGLTKPNKRIGVLCTLPTEGESSSPKVSKNANEVLAELSKMANKGEISPLIIVDNEKISQLYPGLTVRNFWPTINNTVAGLFDIFNRLSAQPSNYTSFDAVDYQSILECGGACIMGLTKVHSYKDKFDLSRAMKDNLTKTLLADGFDLSSAKVAGAIVVGGHTIFANTPGLQDSIDHAFDVVADLTGKATIHRGIFEDNKSSLRVYTLIGGLKAPNMSLEQLRMAA